MLRTSRDLMHGPDELPLVAAPDAAMDQAIVVMSAKRFGCVGVLRRRTADLIGVITDGDLRRHRRPGKATPPAR